MHAFVLACMGCVRAGCCGCRVLSKWMTYWWGWDIIDHWMMTGEFVYRLPVLGEWIKWKDPAGKPPCDW